MLQLTRVKSCLQAFAENRSWSNRKHPVNTIAEPTSVSSEVQEVIL
jgi:hypothetical protein